ncbi:MAG: NADP-dependent oxidoreductase [Microbacteriaceae bacterium]|nr:NADP-dependent oxidoreductase [Microbacteriaceae bacterium]
MSENIAETMTQVEVAKWGEPGELVARTVPVPQPTPGKVLVKVASIGLNPVDWKTRSGAGIAGLLDISQPVVLGWDIAGTIVATGPDTTGFAAGDEVFGMVAFPRVGNAYAEYVLADARDLARVPSNLPLKDAAALPLVGLTAWQALHDIARIEAGQKVLIHAGAGGVGHIAVQLAKLEGADVYATASPKNHDFLRELGAEPINYQDRANFAELPKFDLILDTIGGDTYDLSLELLKPGATIISVPDPSRVAEGRAAGFNAHWLLVHPNSAQLTHLAELVEQGKLRVEIDRRFGLHELPAAHEYGQKGHTRGKIVVNP